MSSPLALETNPQSTFICECEMLMRSACEGLPFYQASAGKRYCVLHFPDKDKSEAFRETLKRKLDAKDFNFVGVWFPNYLSFSKFQFTDEANFNYATFNENVDFSNTIFYAGARFAVATFSKGANFNDATFKGEAQFNNAHFRSEETNFKSAIFLEKSSFYSATFNGDTYFTQAKFKKDINFQAATFMTVAIFYHAEFDGRAELSLTKFNGQAHFFSATFKGLTNFGSATFDGQVEFTETTFVESTSFGRTAFKAEAHFFNTIFIAEASFRYATFFKETIFANVMFNVIGNFSYATFVDYVRFYSDKDKQLFGDILSLDFQHTRIEKPDHVSFHTLTLLPHWFVNVDARKFDFTNVDWRSSIGQEIQNLKDKHVSSPYRLLAIAYRQLAVNAEENHRYEEASMFRYWAMDVQRWETLRGSTFWMRIWRALRRTVTRLSRSLGRDWGVQGRTWIRSKRFWRQYWERLGLLHWLYWVASGYGEKVTKAFMVLVGIWLAFALLYTQVGFIRSVPKVTGESLVVTERRDEVGEPLRLSRALTYSLGVMTLQKPEPRPATIWAERLIIFESVFGPLQAALLALAIRRKFMR